MFFLWSLVLAALFMRPHEHTFQGLDSSALRLMAGALEGGRPLRSTDATLREAPIEVRGNLLFRLPHPGERMTRDRAFEVLSLETGETRPFF